MADLTLNPFLDDIFDATNPDFSRGNVEWIHLSALVRLHQSAGSLAGRQDFGTGKVALVTAPRAGFGKSHLIARLSGLGGAGVLSARLRFEPDSALSWTALLNRTVSDLHQSAEPGAGCGLLDAIGRRAFASATRQMIAEAKIPSADPVQAMAALERDSVGLFDLGNDAQVVARWFNQYFNQLQPTVAEILARRSGISIEKANAWTNRFYSYVSQPDLASRADAFRASLPQGDEATSKQSLHEFLRIATLPRPCILVADDLDGFYRNRDAGQHLAHMLLELAKMSPRLLVVIAANEDLWEASFGLHIASAYEDRLTAQRIRLGGLDDIRARQLVRNRLLLAGHTSPQADEFDRYLALEDLLSSLGSPRVFSPRDILRYAASQWVRYRAGEPSPRIPKQPDDAPAPKADKNIPLAPMPTPPQAWPEVRQECAEPLATASPTGTEIFDELTRDSISEAARNLVGTKSVTKAPPVPSEPQPLESTDPDEGKVDDVVPELVGHTQPAAPAPSGKNGNSGILAAPQPSPPSVFAEDKDNPFQKLKQMLSKLRAEREVQRQSDSRSLVEAERNRIARESEPAPPATPPTRGESAAPPPPQGSNLVSDFHRERDLILRSGHTLPIIQSHLCDLARAAGERFPVISFDEPEVAAGDSAVRWSFDDNEILFGTKPLREHAYWERLGSFAKSRAEDAKSHVKMIVFSSADEPIDIDAILGGSNDLVGIADFTILDRRSLASLYAAHRLITGGIVTGGNAPEAHAADDVLGKLAGELDFFWKRVTRPLPGNRGTSVAG